MILMFETNFCNLEWFSLL